MSRNPNNQDFVRGHSPADNRGNTSDGSYPYIDGRIRADSRAVENGSGGYMEPQSKIKDEIICDSCGLFKDRHGYLILSNFGSKGKSEKPEYFKPVPEPRPSDSFSDPRYGIHNDLPRRQGCGRLTCVFSITITILLLGSIGGNVYLYLQWSAEDDTTFQPPTCPQAVHFKAGSMGIISCSLQYNQPIDQPSIEIYLMSYHRNSRQTFLSMEQPPTTELITQTIEESNATIEVDFSQIGETGRVDIRLIYDEVKCCSKGDLYINISGNMLVKIEVDVDADMPCSLSHTQNVKTLNAISCTRCFCGDYISMQLPSDGTWTYDHTSPESRTSAVQEGRVFKEQDFNRSTGLVTYRLVFNQTACYDGGDYALEVSETINETLQLNFTLDITAGVSFDAGASSSTVQLLTESEVAITACVSMTPSAFLSSQNLTYNFIGNADSLEILQVENTTVVSNEVSGVIGLVPAMHQNIAIDPFTGNSIQIRTVYESGLLTIRIYFDRVQCFHGGVYWFYANDRSLYNLTVSVDDSNQRTQTTIYQLSEETGFVERYDIALECGAVVGCTKRPYSIEPPIATANTTLNHTLDDLNSDGIKDVFVATITSVVMEIPMSLNNTEFTCLVTGDEAMPQRLSYTILVLEGTFCDSRAKNWEYEYPYRTMTTCAWWVSCLDDRPRVKMCGQNNLFYHNTGQSQGQCVFGCPWFP